MTIEELTDMCNHLRATIGAGTPVDDVTLTYDEGLGRILLTLPHAPVVVAADEPAKESEVPDATPHPKSRSMARHKTKSL